MIVIITHSLINTKSRGKYVQEDKARLFVMGFLDGYL